MFTYEVLRLWTCTPAGTPAGTVHCYQPIVRFGFDVNRVVWKKSKGITKLGESARERWGGGRGGEWRHKALVWCGDGLVCWLRTEVANSCHRTIKIIQSTHRECETMESHRHAGKPWRVTKMAENGLWMQRHNVDSDSDNNYNTGRTRPTATRTKTTRRTMKKKNNKERNKNEKQRHNNHLH